MTFVRSAAVALATRYHPRTNTDPFPPRTGAPVPGTAMLRGSERTASIRPRSERRSRPAVDGGWLGSKAPAPLRRRWAGAAKLHEGIFLSFSRVNHGNMRSLGKVNSRRIIQVPRRISVKGLD